jgi:hypothetical protein
MVGGEMVGCDRIRVLGTAAAALKHTEHSTA